jgi:hypothetical protein
MIAETRGKSGDGDSAKYVCKSVVLQSVALSGVACKLSVCRAR